jgi:hypothetical protein
MEKEEEGRRRRRSSRSSKSICLTRDMTPTLGFYGLPEFLD